MEKATWTTTQLDLVDENQKDIMGVIEYIGTDFKAYDETYDLTFEILVSSSLGDIKIRKFPIVAFAYTDVGYKKIYQGINVTPQFKLDKTFELELLMKIQ